MSNTITLDIEERTQGQNPRQIRANGNLPITIYGKGMDSVSAQINTHEFKHISRDNKDAVYELKLGKKTYKTVVQNLQINYGTTEELNVEFKVI